MNKQTGRVCKGDIATVVLHGGTIMAVLLWHFYSGIATVVSVRVRTEKRESTVNV